MFYILNFINYSIARNPVPDGSLAHIKRVDSSEVLDTKTVIDGSIITNVLDTNADYVVSFTPPPSAAINPPIGQYFFHVPEYIKILSVSVVAPFIKPPRVITTTPTATSFSAKKKKN